MIGINNKKIGFIIDSSFGLDEQAEDIRVVPLGVTVNLNGQLKAYKDGVDFNASALIDAFEHEADIKTSQASMPDMMLAAQQMSSQYDEVYVFPIHKALSGNYNTWQILKEDFPKLKIVMSNTIANTLLWLIKDFREVLKKQDMSEAQAQAWFDEESKYIAGFLMVQDMTQLVKGGRVSKLKAGLARILGVKPVILQDETGLIPIDKVKNYEGFFKVADDYISNKWTGKEILNELILVQHSYEDETKLMIAEFEKHYSHKPAEIHEQAIVVSSHAGARSCSVMFRVKK